MGLVVDAKPQAAPFYRKYGFVPIAVTDGELKDESGESFSRPAS